MSGRDQLIRNWHDRLAQTEAELELASPHRRWVKRIYVRLFRFLLAVYGGGDWTADEKPKPPDGNDAPDDDGSQASMEFVDLRADTEGAPPKSAAEIRHTLKTVHNAAMEPVIGPHAEGLQPDDWIVAASQRDGVLLDRFFRELYRAGIPCRRGRLGRDRVIEVRVYHEEEALELLKTLGDRLREAPRHRNVRRERALRCWVAAVTGGFFGAVLPVVGFVAHPDYHASAMAGDLVLMILLGMLGGGIFGALVGSRRARGRR